MTANDKILKLNSDGTCSAGMLAKYPKVSSPDGSITVNPVQDTATGEFDYQVSFIDQTVTYSFTEVNGQDGDGIIAIKVVGSQQPAGTEVMNVTLTMGEPESDGIHLAGDYSFDATTGVLTIQTTNDLTEAAGTPMIVNLEAWLQNQFVGAGATTAIWDGSRFVISSEDETNTLVDNGDLTFTWTPVDNNGNPTGAPVTFSAIDDECAEFAASPTDFASFKLHGCDSGGKGSASLCEVFANIPTTTDFIGG